MDRPWLAAYPPGVPSTIDPDRLASLSELITESCERYAGQPAYTCFGHTLSYAEMERLSRHFGAYLQQTLGLSRGDRVALMMPNLLQYPVTLFGLLRAGLIAVNVNPLYTPRELEHQLRDSGAETIVILENFAHTLEQVLPRTPVRHVIVTRLGDLLPRPKGLLINLVARYVKRLVPRWRIADTLPLRRVLAGGRHQTLEPPALGHDDLAFLQYTGGTTGTAKGAMLSHGNMVANVLQVEAWLRNVIEPGREVVVTPLPLYHIFSLTANCLVFFGLGAHNVLITNPRDMKGFVRTLERYPFTVLTGVNTLYNGLLNAPGFERLDFRPLKAAIAGGMALQRVVAERWKAATGKPLLEGYGLTETSPVACVNPLDLSDYNASIGLPLPSTDARFCDEQGAVLPPGEVGELCLRGPQVMRGYWNRPEETEQILDAEGWLHTGDMGYMDENGYVRIVDRKKDMILVSGFNVYPNEIEDVLVSHPGVLEAAAIGLPDERTGERIRAYVVARDPAPSQDELIQHCRRDLTAYKIPREIEFRSELPKSNVGKILRRELREDALRQLERSTD